MKAPANPHDRRYLRLLKMGPFRRRRGGWRFGTNRLSDDVIERLVADGRVVRDGETITLARKEAS